MCTDARNLYFLRTTPVTTLLRRKGHTSISGSRDSWFEGMNDTVILPVSDPIYIHIFSTL